MPQSQKGEDREKAKHIRFFPGILTSFWSDGNLRRNENMERQPTSDKPDKHRAKVRWVDDRTLGLGFLIRKTPRVKVDGDTGSTPEEEYRSPGY
jgi:hypothetical protein